MRFRTIFGERGAPLFTFVLVAAVVVGIACVARRMSSAGRDALMARDWASALTHEQAEAAHEERRRLMVDYLVDPGRFRDGDADQIREQAVAAKGRLNELAGRPHGASFRVNYRTHFVTECGAAARSIQDTGARGWAGPAP